MLLANIFLNQDTIEMETKIVVIFFSPKQQKNKYEQIRLSRNRFTGSVKVCDYRVNNQICDFHRFSLTETLTVVLEEKSSKNNMQN